MFNRQMVGRQTALSKKLHSLPSSIRRHPQQTGTKPAAEAPRNERANHFFSLLCGTGR
jgi:hypothetical protein